MWFKIILKFYFVGLPDSEIDKYIKDVDTVTYDISEDGKHIKAYTGVEGKPERKKDYDVMTDVENEDVFDGMKEKVNSSFVYRILVQVSQSTSCYMYILHADDIF